MLYICLCVQQVWLKVKGFYKANENTASSCHWRCDVLFPLVTCAVCGWIEQSCDASSASGGSWIAKEAPGLTRQEVGRQSSGRESCNPASQWCFPEGSWCLRPSLTPPRGKQMQKGFSLPDCTVGFQSSSHCFVNPDLHGKWKGCTSACSVPQHRVTKPT